MLYIVCQHAHKVAFLFIHDLQDIISKLLKGNVCKISQNENWIYDTVLTSWPCFQIMKAGLERVCFTKQVRLRTLPDSMKTFGLPNMDATGSEMKKV